MDGSMAASAWATAGIVTFPFLFFVSAPYGKLGRDGWGPRIDGRLGWCLQELPSPLALLYGIYTSNAASSADSCGAWMSTWKDGAPSMVLVAVALWCAHYANRAVWYPLTRHMSHTTMPVVASAVAFNLVNGTLMGRELARRTCEPFTIEHVPGLCVMLLGAAINVSADAALLRLRSARGDGGGKGRKGGGASRKSTHKVPTGGLFDVVTAPHYLGECVEWSGFAAMTGTAAAWAFAFWTFANLFPRAVAYKRWYREKFGDKYVIRRAMF